LVEGINFFAWSTPRRRPFDDYTPRAASGAVDSVLPLFDAVNILHDAVGFGT
jgi:hypothetical protein